jgi:hypothetical protein
MDKPAIIRALEADPRLVDYAGMAMYKIREPVGNTRLTFQQITVGKQTRNRQLAVRIITQVLERYPDPQGIQSVDEVKNYMAEVMYRTLAPTKAEHFPLDQRTPFARTYYREKAESFFYDFLSPIAEYARAEIPSSSLRLDASQPTMTRVTPSATGKQEQMLVSREDTRLIQAGQVRQNEHQTSGATEQTVAESAFGNPSIPDETTVATANNQTVLIGILSVLVVLLLILLLFG